MKDKIDMAADIPQSILANKDLIPSQQTWSWYNIFAFWMSDVHSAGGYIFAGTLFSLGLAGWQVFISLIAGILIIWCSPTSSVCRVRSLQFRFQSSPE